MRRNKLFDIHGWEHPSDENYVKMLKIALEYGVITEKEYEAQMEYYITSSDSTMVEVSKKYGSYSSLHGLIERSNAHLRAEHGMLLKNVAKGNFNDFIITVNLKHKFKSDREVNSINESIDYHTQIIENRKNDLKIAQKESNDAMKNIESFNLTKKVIFFENVSYERNSNDNHFKCYIYDSLHDFLPDHDSKEYVNFAKFEEVPFSWSRGSHPSSAIVDFVEDNNLYDEHYNFCVDKGYVMLDKRVFDFIGESCRYFEWQGYFVV